MPRRHQGRTNAARPSNRGATPWWHDATGYSLYLRSFADGNGDGVGDLRGAIDHLDHLQDLGIDLVWITPFYPSPMLDGGYDVVDHGGIDPRYGDMEDFEELIHQAHERNIAVVIDLVANHTSSRHPWFEAACSSRHDPYHDRYLWADPAPGGGPPNNWVSYFGGPAWTYVEAVGQYYLHLFLPEQPDLNWRDPAVAEIFDRLLHFWLDLGIDGFRVDAAQGLVKDARLRSNPQRHALAPDADRIEQWAAFEHRHDVLQPESIEVFRRWKGICDRYDAVLIGEMSVGDPVAFGRAMVDGGLDVGMWLETMHVEWDAARLRSVLGEPIEAMAGAGLIGWQGSSLDEQRAVTRFGGGEIGRRRAITLATLLAFLPGIPFLYQGEELGLEQGVVGEAERMDPVGVDAAAGRDGCRTPMPWSTGPMHGFTTGESTWLPFAAHADAASVERQRQNCTSPLALHRRLLMIRRRLFADPTIEIGTRIEWLDFDEPGLIGFRRDDVRVVANTSEDAVALDPAGTIVFDSLGRLDGTALRPRPPSGGCVTLNGAQAVVIRVEADGPPPTSLPPKA